MTRITHIAHRDDKRDGHAHRHKFDTGSDGYVIVQVWSVTGALVPLPGAGPSILQLPPDVMVPCLHESYYPLTVVVIS